MEQAFLADGGNWKYFQINSLFNIYRGNIQNQDKLVDDINGIAFIAQNDRNNGYVKQVKITDNRLFKGNVLIIGRQTGIVYFQNHDFVTTDGVLVLTPKNGLMLNKNTGLFVKTIVQKQLVIFGYTNTVSVRKLNEISIPLPVKNNQIAFGYMQRVVQELQAERLQELQAYLQATGLSDYVWSKQEKSALDLLENVNAQGGVKPFKIKELFSNIQQGERLTKADQISGSLKWKEFNLKELFGAATRGKRLKSTDRIPGELPFVTAGEADVGISDFIGNDVDVFAANTVTIDMFGSAKYRNYQYGADDHVAVVHSQNWQKHAVLFLAAAIHKVANAGQFSYSRNFYAKDADELNILLPEKDGKPDTELMSQIGRAIEKLVIADVVKFNERELAAYRQTIQAA